MSNLISHLPSKFLFSHGCVKKNFFFKPQCFLESLHNLLVSVWWKDSWEEHPQAYVTLRVTQLGDSLLMIRILFFGINPFSSCWWCGCLCCVCEGHGISLVSYGYTSPITSFASLGCHCAWVTAFSSIFQTVADVILMLCMCRGEKNLQKLFFSIIWAISREGIIQHRNEPKHTQASSVPHCTWWVEMGIYVHLLSQGTFPGPAL